MTGDVDISAALRIDGWMSEAELRWLANEARHHSRIVEVGCWLGRSARALADHCRGTLWCVDQWDGNLATGRPSTWRGDALYEAFCNSLGFTHVIPVRRESVDAAVRLSRLRFDMIFLDADHSYEAACADIKAWRPLLSPGGLLCGHDFSEEFNGVRRAVRELCPEYKLGPGWLWYVPPGVNDAGP